MPGFNPRLLLTGIAFTILGISKVFTNDPLLAFNLLMLFRQEPKSSPTSLVA